MSNYATKSEVKETTGDIVSSKLNVDKLDTDKLKSVPTSLNNLESKANKINTHKLKIVLVDFKKLNDLVEKDNI